MIKRSEEEIYQNWKERDIIVSICTITYNHQDFISDALDSFLSQETTFAFEIVIDDDCSTDNTASIIREYQKKYPNIIRANLREKNIGAMPNFVSNMQRAKGKYIALCEGDDYWIDNYKLQTQIDFLENNLEYSSCASNSKVIYQNIDKIHNFKQNIKDRLNIDDILHYHQFQTASFVFRKDIIVNTPLPLDIFSGDKALFFISTTYGYIKYFDKEMSIYRKHNSGLSSNLKPKQLLKDLNIIPFMLKKDKKFKKNRFKAYIYENILRVKNIKVLTFVKYYFIYIYYSFSFFPKNILYIIGFSKQLILKVIK